MLASADKIMVDAQSSKMSRIFWPRLTNVFETAEGAGEVVMTRVVGSVTVSLVTTMVS